MQIQIPDVASRFLKDNITTVLTAGGVVGTAATGVLAFRAGMKYQHVVATESLYRWEKREKGEEPTPIVKMESAWDKAKIAAVPLIPPLAAGGLTIGSIIMAHRMSAAKAAALAAVYGISQKQLEEYKAKLEEKLGLSKYEKAKTEMAQERANNTPGSGAIVIFGDEVLCFDEATGRYFKSTMEKIRRAQNQCNQQILETGFADAGQFYSLVDLPGTRWSDDVGWDKPFDVTVSTIIVDDKPCLSLDFNPLPVLDYNRKGGFHRYS